MIPAGVTVEAANRENLGFIFDHLRPSDVEEFALHMDPDRDGFIDSVLGWTEAIVGRIEHGDPFVVVGHQLFARTVYYAAFGTPVLDQFIHGLTRCARGYIRARMAQHPMHRHLIAVDHRHAGSRNWLRILGFRETGHHLDQRGGRLLLLER